MVVSSLSNGVFDLLAQFINLGCLRVLDELLCLLKDRARRSIQHFNVFGVFQTYFIYAFIVLGSFEQPKLEKHLIGIDSISM